jgi:hypothetical protein
MRLSTGATSKWLFVLGLPSGSPEIVTIGTPATLKAHNFLCRPLIVMRSKEKLYPSSRTFQRYVARRLYARELGRFPTFSGQESNCQFDSRPFFGHNLCYKCPNGSCEAIFDIYALIPFQRYEEYLKARCFDPCNRVLNFWKSRRTPKSPFRECECHPHTPSKWGCDSLGFCLGSNCIRSPFCWIIKL